MRHFKIYFLFIASVIKLSAQNEASKWYFGVNAGLDFMTSPITILTNSQMNSWEGCSAISDQAGNLLFYSDGNTIWNSTHSPMANGTGLAGLNTSTQSSIIIKQPGNSNIYFIFTLMGNLIGGLSYSTIDMNLAAGMGSVTVKNSVAYSGTCTEKLAATKHCNGQDIWVVSHDNNNTNFRAFLITTTGVSSVAVVSSIGSTHLSYHGQMKISPNGRKLGVSLQYVTNVFEVFDFNSATGVVSNCIPLTPSTIWYNSSYGCEFSPDGTKFYGTSDGKIFQWDLCAGTNSNIIQTEYNVSNGGEFSLQVASNGKIYGTRQADSSLSVIHNPNLAGSACNYAFSGQIVSPKTTYWGLPNFVSSYFKKVKEFDFSIDSVDCQKIHFFKPCTSSPGPMSFLWDFGDQSSGFNQSSTANPIHQFSGAGTYTVQLIMYYNCGSDTVTRQIIVPNVPTITITGNQSICAGQTATLVASGAISYSWNTSVIGPMINVSPLSTMVYTVTGSTSINNCRSKTTVTVTIKDLPNVSISGNKTVCESDTLILMSSGATSYTWNSGTSGTVQIIPSPVSGSVVSVTGSAQNGCQSTASVTLYSFPNPTIIVTGNNEICAGESTTLIASGGNNYVWPQYGSGPTLPVSPLGTTIYTVTGTSSPLDCQTTAFYLVNVSLCTGLSDNIVSIEKHISIYPNPAVNRIHVKTNANTDIRIYDVHGRIVYTGFIEVGENSIDVSHLNNGIFSVYMPILSKELIFLKISE